MLTQSLSGPWQFREQGQDAWLPATVPGGVHTDLLALDLIPDPFSGDNELNVAWVAERTWEYRRTFRVPAELRAQERLFLVCDGLDTLATVSLNGQVLGETANMFREFRWDVTGLLREGDNELHVAFRSPVRYCAEQDAQRFLPTVSQSLPGSPHLRKAPCQFGWDWGPQLPPIGIWRDLRLEAASTARLDGVHVRQEHGTEVAIVAAVRVEQWSDAPLAATVVVVAPDGPAWSREDDLAAGEAALRVPIPDPQLWWPNGYGQQPLYEVEVRLHPAGRPDAVLDSRRCQVGVRTLELRRDDDEWGQSFTFVVNGVPIFAKGSNWIPADSFPTRLITARLEQLLSSAAATHQNMVRVWGGGCYEDERFYDLCDRYGILVWQDFIFSCSVYPLHDPEFLENVRGEVRDNVRRLRHRACLALWCGNNEMEEGWVHWGWDRPEHQDLKEAFERFFYHTLPAWVAEEDADHPYWPSSPSSNLPFQNPRSNERGDAHYWEVWHGLKPFTAYRTQLPRFMSEFGFQSLPPFPTIESFAEEPEWNMTSYVMERHQKNARGNTLIVAQMLDNYRLPRGFRELVYMSMVLQAEGIRYGVEHWRRARARVGGTIYWQLNDCWPVASWASLDYFGRWKALHYAARRFFAPVLLSIEDNGPQMDIFLTSDRMEPRHGQVRWSLETLDGQVLDAAVQPVEAAPLATTPVLALDLSAQVHEDNRRNLIFVAELWEDGRWISQQVATFVPNKHLELVDPALTVSLTQPAPDQVQVELRAQTLARFVEVSFDGLDTVFSDNYLDVRTGRPVVLTAPVPAGTTLEQLQKALRVQSLYGAYATSVHEI